MAMQTTQEEKTDIIPLILNVFVKARDRKDGESLVATRLNKWFIETTGKAPYPRGTLLLWGFFKEGATVNEHVNE